MNLPLFTQWLAEWGVWGFTDWLSKKGLTDLLAAVGTVAATSFAVWQSGAAARDRRTAGQVAANAALVTIEGGVAAMLDPDLSPVEIGTWCDGLHTTLLEIPVAQMPTPAAVKALISARGSLHAVASRMSRQVAARQAATDHVERMLATMYGGWATELEALQVAANEIRAALNLPQQPVVQRAKRKSSPPASPSPANGAVI